MKGKKVLGIVFIVFIALLAISSFAALMGSIWVDSTALSERLAQTSAALFFGMILFAFPGIGVCLWAFDD